jgi:multiple sugar transport system ATP-binding protein
LAQATQDFSTALAESKGMAEIQVHNIHKKFGQLQLFQNFTLGCPDHMYVCLLGPSGCGKTTLMRIIAGLAAPDAGDVLIGGRRVTELPPVARNIGLAFQNYALYPHLSVAGNLAFPLRAPVRRARYDEASISASVKRIAALLKMETLLDRYVNQLSGGQQQRVALGRALIHDPQVLLLDEPVTHLDARLRYEMRAEIKLLHKRIGTTTIHVTHDQQEALAMGDLIAVMREGRLEQFGKPLELYEEPANAFVAGFIGDPPMSVIRGRLATEGSRTFLRIGKGELPLPDQLADQAQAAKSAEVLVGIRPPEVTLTEPSEADLDGAVYSHEMVGREQQLIVSTGEGGEIRCRLKRAIRATAGTKVGLKLSLAKARLFDAASGKSLALEPSKS